MHDGEIKLGLVSDIIVSDSMPESHKILERVTQDRAFENWKKPYVPATKGDVWLRFELENNTDLDVEYVVSTGFGSRIESRLFLTVENQVKEITRSGSFLSGQINHHHFVFLFPLRAKERTFAYLYLANLPHVKLEPKIYHLAKFQRQMDTEKYMFGIFSGTIITMLLYNFSLFVFTRRIFYLNYVAFVFLFYFVVLHHMSGVLWQYYITHPWPNLYATQVMWVAVVGGMYFSCQFVRDLLEVRLHSPGLDKLVVRSCAYLIVVASPAMLIDASVVRYLSILSFMLLLIIYFVICIVFAVRGVRNARLSLFAFSVLLFGAFFYMLGVLGVFSGTNVARYSLYIGAALESVLLSIALAQRINFLDEAKTKLEVQLEISKSLQEHLLPRSELPTSVEAIYHYTPADHVGGDWLYYHVDSRKEWVYIVLADVTGHGVSSSMVTSVLAGTVISIFNSTEFSRLSPEKRLHHLAESSNQVLFQTASHVGKFATMSIAALDTRKGELYYVNAGHNGFYLKSDNTVTNLGKAGSMLGHTLQPKFGYLKLTLSHKDVLFFYTDGLTENEGLSVARLTERNLKKLIESGENVHAINGSILKRTQEIWGNRRAEDDVSFIILQFFQSDLGLKQA